MARITHRHPSRITEHLHAITSQVHGISEAEWRAIRRHSLLTKEEQLYLQEYRGSRPHLAAAWALAEVKAAILQPKEGERYDPNHSQLQTMADLTVYNSFKAVYEEFVRHCGASLEVLNQPVPFPYFHVLKLMMLVVLGTIAYELVTLFEGMWVVSMFTFVVVAAMLLGLMEIANKMSDPFGTDDTDFDTHKLCDDAYRNAVAYLSTGYLKTLSEEHMSRASSFKAGKGKKKDMRKEVFDNLEIVQGNPLRVFHTQSEVFSSAGFAALTRRMSGKDLMSGVQLSHEDDVAA